MNENQNNTPAPSLLDAAKAMVNAIEHLGNMPWQTSASWWDGLAHSRKSLRAAIAAEEAREKVVGEVRRAYKEFAFLRRKSISEMHLESERLRAENAELRAGLEEIGNEPCNEYCWCNRAKALANKHKGG